MSLVPSDFVWSQSANPPLRKGNCPYEVLGKHGDASQLLNDFLAFGRVRKEIGNWMQDPATGQALNVEFMSKICT